MLTKIKVMIGDFYYNVVIGNIITLLIPFLIWSIILMMAIFLVNIQAIIIFGFLDSLAIASWLHKCKLKRDTQLEWWQDLPKVYMLDIYKKHYISESKICLQYRIRTIQYYNEEKDIYYVVEGLHSNGEWYNVHGLPFRASDGIRSNYTSKTKFYRVALYIYNWYITATPVDDIDKPYDLGVSHQGGNKNRRVKALPEPQYAEHAAVENIKDPDDWADY